jgi:hypothetical protein
LFDDKCGTGQTPKGVAHSILDGEILFLFNPLGLDVQNPSPGAR